jgi:hypothetical protein
MVISDINMPSKLVPMRPPSWHLTLGDHSLADAISG